MIGKGGATIRALTERDRHADRHLRRRHDRDRQRRRSAAKEAQRRIVELTADVEVGQVYEGAVLRLLDFGAIVQVLPGRDGLLHISEIANYRIANINDVLKVGQQVRVKVIGGRRQGPPAPVHQGHRWHRAAAGRCRSRSASEAQPE